MKPIIVEIDDLSESIEIYEAKPNKILVTMIYVCFVMLMLLFAWVYFFEIEMVVRSDGIFRANESAYEISSGVNGKIIEDFVTYGQYVQEGDMLYAINIDSLSNTIIQHQRQLKNAQERLEILKAYECSLDEGVEKLNALLKNPYYSEFLNRRKLLLANSETSKIISEKEIKIYKNDIDTIKRNIKKHKQKVKYLNMVKVDIVSRKNSFSKKDIYYYELIKSYLTSYELTSLQYDNAILDLQKQKEKYESIINDDKQDSTANKEDILKQRDETTQAIKKTKKEKRQALNSIELEQITNIEQQIMSLNEEIMSMETNLKSSKLQLETSENSNNKSSKDILILTEKGNIAAEILNCQEKINESKENLKLYNIENENCNLKANTTGYYYPSQDLQKGSFVQEGMAIGKIYPKKELQYYAQIYINNNDIAKIKMGQKVKFEIEAYPSNDYGYFTGTISNIAKDITMDSNSNEAYYIVKVTCDNLALKNDEGKEASLINGMACQAKIIVGKEKILRYLIEKLIF